MIFLILLRLALENSKNRGVFLYYEKKTKKKITQP